MEVLHPHRSINENSPPKFRYKVQKSSAVSFPLWSLKKQNSWVKRSKNNMKDIIGISIIVYWRFHLRDFSIRDVNPWF